VARTLPTFLHGGEAELLLQAAAGSPRDLLILHFGLLLGLRVSEITHLDVPHIDLARRSCFVRAGKGDKDRYVPVPSKLIESLRAWIGERREGPLFASPGGGQLSTRALQKLLKRLARKANLPGAEEPRRITPHKLRHDYATRLLETGTDIYTVSELLGHANISTTMVYLHTTDQRKREACERL
jgi:integrase/recombinase XerC